MANRNAEFHTTDQDTDGTTDGDLYFCASCNTFVHYTYVDDDAKNSDEWTHRGHYLET